MVAAAAEKEEAAITARVVVPGAAEPAETAAVEMTVEMAATAQVVEVKVSSAAVHAWEVEVRVLMGAAMVLVGAAKAGATAEAIWMVMMVTLGVGWIEAGESIAALRVEVRVIVVRQKVVETAATTAAL